MHRIHIITFMRIILYNMGFRLYNSMHVCNMYTHINIKHDYYMISQYIIIDNLYIAQYKYIIINNW